MEYTSEQYKYLLLKHLQRHFSLMNAIDRRYTLCFFSNLLDDSVIITKESYNEFIECMNYGLDYCVKENIYSCDEIDISDIENNDVLLINAFEKIGITLRIDTDRNTNGGHDGAAFFTKPNGEEMVYTVDALNFGSGGNLFYINAAARTEYRYAQLSLPYYRMDNMEVVDLNTYPTRLAGDGTYWSYNAATATMTISGNGTYEKSWEEEQLGSGIFNTVIIGPEVSKLARECMSSEETIMVLLHPADGIIEIDPGFNVKGLSCGSENRAILDVYTDCQMAINTLSETTFTSTITLHSLSEWSG